MSQELWRQDRAPQWRRLFKFIAVIWFALTVAVMIICGGINSVMISSRGEIPRFLWVSLAVSASLFVALLVNDRGKRRLSQCQQCGYPLEEQVRKCPFCDQGIEHCIRCGYRLVGEGISRCSECGNPVQG